VLDAEAVAIDRTTGKLMPFQELSRRKRKDVKVEDIQVRVCLFAFDLLYLNGEVSLLFYLSKPFSDKCATCSPSFKNHSTIAEFYYESTSPPCPENLTLPSPLTARRPTKYRHSSKRVSRMGVKV